MTLSGLFCVGFGGPCAGILIGGQVSVFTLPERYRPAAREVFTAITYGLGTYYFGRVDVDPTGTVTITAPPNDGEDWVSLSGLTFRADH